MVVLDDSLICCTEWKTKLTVIHEKWKSPTTTQKVCNRYCHMHSILHHISIKTRHTSFQWYIIHLHVSPYLFKKGNKKDTNLYFQLSVHQNWNTVKNDLNLKTILAFLLDMCWEKTLSFPAHHLRTGCNFICNYQNSWGESQDTIEQAGLKVWIIIFILCPFDVFFKHPIQLHFFRLCVIWSVK